jgi:hypothetical protein
MGEGQALTRARDMARNNGGPDWLDAAARVGLVAYGVVHLVIAWLAVQLAVGDSSGSPSATGAVSELAQKPFGQVLVWAVAVGMFLLVLWQGIEAFVGHRDEDGAKRAAKRAVSAGKAVVYGAIGFSAARAATGSGSSGKSSERKTDSLTARVMDLPAGQVLVGAVGLVILGIGCAFAVRAWTEKYREQLDAEGRSGSTGTAYLWARSGTPPRAWPSGSSAACSSTPPPPTSRTSPAGSTRRCTRSSTSPSARCCSRSSPWASAATGCSAWRGPGT